MHHEQLLARSGLRKLAMLTRIVAIVLVLLAFAPSGARAGTLYRCGMHGEVTTACCCPTSKKHHATGTTLSSACCCHITQLAARDSGPRLAPPSMVAIAAPVVVANVSAVIPPVVPRSLDLVAPPVARGPPVTLFARRCALLI